MTSEYVSILTGRSTKSTKINNHKGLQRTENDDMRQNVGSIMT